MFEIAGTWADFVPPVDDEAANGTLEMGLVDNMNDVTLSVKDRFPVEVTTPCFDCRSNLFNNKMLVLYSDIKI